MRFNTPILIIALTATAFGQKLQLKSEDRTLDKVVVDTLASIKAEAVDSRVDWAGEYKGDFGVDDCQMLWVAPGSGLVSATRTVGRNYSNGNVGEISVEEDVISVTWKFPNDAMAVRPTMSGVLMDKLAIVRSHDNVYLIPLSHLHGFCLATKDEARLRHSHRHWYSKSNSESTTREFVLPEKYRYLQGLPTIEAQVLSVTRQVLEKKNLRKLIHQTLVINRGSKDGVYVGMNFQLGDQSQFAITQSFTVSEVTESTSRVHFQQHAHGRPVRVKPDMVIKTAQY